ncbi:MAG: hypothetical protein LBT10_05920 [Methanobrevibacter sp.]|jgi:predicted nucleic acid-binding protein|nr:hypothetical protein [Methanobrevibacter sp.]
MIFLDVSFLISLFTKEDYDYMNDNLMIVDDKRNYDEAMKKVKKDYPVRIPFFNCVYMALMEDLGISKIASFYEHFDDRKEIIRIHY